LPDADRLIKMCDSDEIKNRLKATTEEAIAKGVKYKFMKTFIKCLPKIVLINAKT
jgi:2-hydroxychromene-2-carboxylate isomerase